jgi:hypothetical protein
MIHSVSGKPQDKSSGQPENPEYIGGKIAREGIEQSVPVKDYAD